MSKKRENEKRIVRKEKKVAKRSINVGKEELERKEIGSCLKSHHRRVLREPTERNQQMEGCYHPT